MVVISLRFNFCFGFFDGFVFCARSCVYAKKPPETATMRGFLIALRPCRQNPSIVLATAALVLTSAGLLRN